MRVRASMLVFPVLLLAVPLAGQIPQGVEGPFQPHPEGTEAISRLYSPYCPGFMLEVCTAPASAALRDSIHALAYEGWSSGELVEWMLANHGEEWLAQPEGRGRGMLAWLLPPVALLAGAVAVTFVLRRAVVARGIADGSAGLPAAEPALTGEQEARLRSAIREIELSEDPSF
jgi:cytochrome c-type biogenesis protein CcmH/NrfF